MLLKTLLPVGWSLERPLVAVERDTQRVKVNQPVDIEIEIVLVCACRRH